MKRVLLGITLFLCIFSIVGTAEALIIPVGSFEGPPTAPYADPPLDDLTSPYIDTAENLNVLIDFYNSTEDPDLPPILGGFDYLANTGGTSGTINTSGYAYLSLKYAGHVDLYFLDGASSYEYDLSNALSHARGWNPTSVPEPSTALLLGMALLGIAGIGRKRIKN